MKNKFKVGDVLIYNGPNRNTKALLLLEVVAVNPEDFKNMYLLKRHGTEYEGISYKNFDIVHKTCVIATPAAWTLYGP